MVFRTYIIVILLFFFVGVNAQDPIKQKMEWNGYTQLRFTTDYGDMNTFAMRRLKFWVKSGPDFSEHWGFKVQAVLSDLQNEKFFLQDVKAMYHSGNFSINLGQFIPAYSLEQFQPDAVIPLTERAPAICALIPDGTLGLRDIGMEGHFQNSTGLMETWLGVFNGYGIKEYQASNKGYMLTNKSAFHLFEKHLSAGYSVMYRKAYQLGIPLVIPEDTKYSGPDIRYNLFAMFQLQGFLVQAEYLNAALRHETADGYYVLAMLKLGKSQLVTSFDQYHNPVVNTENVQTVHLGYNYLIREDKLKVMLDNSYRIGGDDGHDFFSTVLQCQVFFK